jgi:hypothetical protein
VRTGVLLICIIAIIRSNHRSIKTAGLVIVSVSRTHPNFPFGFPFGPIGGFLGRLLLFEKVHSLYVAV